MRAVSAGLLGSIALGGCQLVFSLEGTPGRDGAALCVETTTHDEDGDTIVDPCDPCPGEAVLGTHSDLDGIPDECDPRPALEGDVLAEFLSFAEADAATRWRADAASWQVGTDELRFADPGPSYATMRDARPAPAIPFAVAARVVIEAPPAVEGTLTVSGWSAAGQVVCGLERKAGLDHLILWYGNLAGQNDQAVIPPIAPGASYLVELHVEPGMARCKLRLGASEVGLSLPGTPEPTTIGFEAAGLAARVPYASVFARQ